MLKELTESVRWLPGEPLFIAVDWRRWSPPSPLGEMAWEAFRTLVDILRDGIAREPSSDTMAVVRRLRVAAIASEPSSFTIAVVRRDSMTPCWSPPATKPDVRLLTPTMPDRRRALAATISLTALPRPPAGSPGGDGEPREGSTGCADRRRMAWAR